MPTARPMIRPRWEDFLEGGEEEEGLVEMLAGAMVTTETMEMVEMAPLEAVVREAEV